MGRGRVLDAKNRLIHSINSVVIMFSTFSQTHELVHFEDRAATAANTPKAKCGENSRSSRRNISCDCLVVHVGGYISADPCGIHVLAKPTPMPDVLLQHRLGHTALRSPQIHVAKRTPRITMHQISQQKRTPRAIHANRPSRPYDRYNTPTAVQD